MPIQRRRELLIYFYQWLMSPKFTHAKDPINYANCIQVSPRKKHAKTPEICERITLQFDNKARKSPLANGLEGLKKLYAVNW